MSSGCRRKRRRRWRLPCSRMRPGIGGRAMCHRRRELGGQRFLGRFRMHEAALLARARSGSFAPLRMTTLLRVTILSLFLGGGLLPFLSCSRPPDPNTLVMIIESSPTNLDPRVGIDAQSERIDELLFDALLTRDDHFNVQPGLAERWEIPDPLTYVFHLHRGVTFHDGRPLTSRDVKWTFDSLLRGKDSQHENGSIPFCRSHRSARRFYSDISSKGAQRDFAVESLRGRDLGLSPMGRLTRSRDIRSAAGPSSFLAQSKIRKLSSSEMTITGEQKPRLDRVRFAVVPIRRRGRSNCAKAARMLPSTR